MDITAPIYTDDNEARAYLEAQRWPEGASCPHCQSADVYRLEGKGVRPGAWHCKGCRKQFSVTVGTVMERSHIAIRKWVLAMHLMASSKKGMSAHQLHRMMGITYKSAWFLAHRIREAMTDANPGPLGGGGKVVEADETYFGAVDNPAPRNPKKPPYTKGGRSGPANKRAVVSLVERGGKVISFHTPKADLATVTRIVNENIARETRLVTDESRLYIKPGKDFASHETVKHSHKEYARGDVHTNSVEGYFSIFKRGMKGIYQHCGEQHLQRYLTEFDFRYSNRKISDFERAALVAKGTEGRRLTYRGIDRRAA